MDLKEIGKQLAEIGLPILGAALPVPGGMAIGKVLASLITGKDNVEDLVPVLKENADKLLQAKQFELQNQTELVRIQVNAEIEAIKAVNTTMQSESASDHWPTYSWRPFIGFSFGAYIVSLWMLPLFGKAPVTLSPDVVMAVGAILGVASWFRGRMQADPNVKSDNRG